MKGWSDCRVPGLVGLLVLALVGSATGQPAGAEHSPRTRLAFHVSAAADLHFYVRALAQGKVENVPDAYRSAVEAAKTIEAVLGRGTWGAIEPNLGQCESAKDVHKQFADLPEQFTPQRGPTRKTVALRELATKLADAYVACEPYFLEHTWPDHRRIVEEDLARVKSEFVPHYDELLAYMLKHLGVQDPHITVPIYLVAEAYFPGAFTMRQYGGAPIMFVQTRRTGHEGTLLYELILHESCHTLDMGGDSVFSELREKLSAAGLSPRRKLFRDVPHTIMFVQAAETIRRVLDDKHKAYGDVAGYYRRVGFAGKMVPPIWIEYLDGKITRDEALDRMVAATIEYEEDK